MRATRSDGAAARARRCREPRARRSRNRPRARSRRCRTRLRFLRASDESPARVRHRARHRPCRRALRQRRFRAPRAMDRAAARHARQEGGARVGGEPEAFARSLSLDRARCVRASRRHRGGAVRVAAEGRSGILGQRAAARHGMARSDAGAARFRGYGRARRRARPRHRGRHGGAPSRRRPRQAGLGAAARSAGFPLDGYRGCNAVVPDDAALSAAATRRLERRAAPCRHRVAGGERAGRSHASDPP